MDFQKMLNRALGIKTITIENILENKDKKPKRICFETTHQEACRRIEMRGNTAVGAMNLPFDESIRLFIEDETKLNIRETRNGKFWCPANSDEEFERLEHFFEKYKKNVFIRDTLECSIALSEHMLDDESRTEIGELEYQAKYNQSEVATNRLTEILANLVNNTGVFDGVDFVCAIPASKKGEKNLPQKISEALVKLVKNKINISELVEWKKDKPKIKELELDEKLETLNETDLSINFDIKNKDIILIDDLYQSGFTMQFVAMKLKEAGAREIFGISIVKSRRDTDNI